MLAIIYLKNGEIGEGGEEREILRAFKSLKKNKNLRNSFRRIFILETTSILSSVLLSHGKTGSKKFILKNNFFNKLVRILNYHHFNVRALKF